ncbi:unnamed protein product [Strongylus vulgaris]|uniref:Peptidase M12B domain-containing protein n=1 Tax=Strongylus vulgaris TaxID=40348 RepID=A0A3P7M496_STRVU|nr:unnamed protein product [Strongylus vulgaris]
MFFPKRWMASSYQKRLLRQNFLRFDLISPRGDSGTQGMAYVGNICQGFASASIVEDVGAAATALIAAHELGHSTRYPTFTLITPNSRCLRYSQEMSPIMQRQE